MLGAFSHFYYRRIRLGSAHFSITTSFNTHAIPLISGCLIKEIYLDGVRNTYSSLPRPNDRPNPYRRIMASTPLLKALERVAVLAGSFLSGIQTLGHCNGYFNC